VNFSSKPSQSVTSGFLKSFRASSNGQSSGTTYFAVSMCLRWLKQSVSLLSLTSWQTVHL
jgi:hypothetical protein